MSVAGGTAVSRLIRARDYVFADSTTRVERVICQVFLGKAIVFFGFLTATCLGPARQDVD
ncbi:MAG: hypothetical protein EBS05_04385 [Proteobacteria bacterium]|nr:hypothetical protein [Pseudomonadota bacterium]